MKKNSARDNYNLFSVMLNKRYFLRLEGGFVISEKTGRYDFGIHRWF